MKRVGVSFGFFVSSASIAFLADLATKAEIVRRLAPGSSVSVFGELVRISHVRNLGASFGLFPGSTATLIAVSSTAVLVVLYLALRSRGRLAAMAFLGLILGGALGNLYDRVRLGEVVDFIDVGIGSYRWPVFNVADVAVTIGVFLMLLEYLRRGGESAGCSGGPEGEDERGKVTGGESGAGEPRPSA